MSTNLKKPAVLAGTAAALPALLFLGAGTAQANTSVSSATDAAGVTVTIRSVIQPGGDVATASSGWCSYTAVPADVPAGILPPLPVYDVPFFLQEEGRHNLWFPGIQTGTTWDVTVHCSEGVDSPTQKVTY